MKRNQNPYPDNIFGGVNHPKKGAQYHREHALGIHHFSSHHPNPVVTGEPILSWAVTSTDLAFESVTARFSLDDWQSESTLAFQKAGVQWDTLAWSWQQHWLATFPALEPNQILRYQLWGTLANGKKVFADNQAKSAKKATEYAIWNSPHPHVPEWSKTARIYQIFVDRFNRNLREPWLENENLHGFFGGNLFGIINKMNYIQNLGFNTLWLTPIFRTPSHHGYDTTAYDTIEPRFGCKADLQDLIERAHKRNIRVVLDFVANHVSNQHPMFIKALSSPTAPERAWFRWKRWPHYETFADVKTMPKLNLDFGSPAREHLLEVAQDWLRLGVDGFRLDHANGPDRAFWVDFRRTCQAINPDAWLFAEVVLPPDAQASYLGSFHGTLDFMAAEALRESFARQSWDIGRLANFLTLYHKQFPKDFSRPAFIDNHDMNRFLFTALGNKKALHAALRLLYLMPGQPIVYCGTEQDLSQHKSIHAKGSYGFDEARLPMDWAKPETETAVLLRELAQIREENPWLVEAEWSLLSLDEKSQTAIMRVCKDEDQLEVAICLKEGEQSVALNQA